MENLKRCCSCKLFLEYEKFAKSASCKDGLQKVCKNCRSNYIKTDAFKETQRKWRQSIRGKWKFYRKNARRRNVPFLLTFEEFESFWQKPCTYCGALISTIGIDRIDTLDSYKISNCCSCCTICNWMKMDLTKDEFLSHIKSIISFCK